MCVCVIQYEKRLVDAYCYYNYYFYYNVGTIIIIMKKTTCHETSRCCSRQIPLETRCRARTVVEFYEHSQIILHCVPTFLHEFARTAGRGVCVIATGDVRRERDGTDIIAIVLCTSVRDSRQVRGRRP